MNAVRKIKFFSWNVKGLNDKVKRSLVKQEIQKEQPQVLCLQETKWSNPSRATVNEAMGPRYANYITIPACGVAGGVIVAWDDNFFEEIEHMEGTYCLTVMLHLKLDNSVIRFTGVYGPSNQRISIYFSQNSAS